MEGEMDEERGWQNSRARHISRISWSRLSYIIMYWSHWFDFVWFDLCWTERATHFAIIDNWKRRRCRRMSGTNGRACKPNKKSDRAKMFHVQVLSVFEPRQAHMMSMHAYVCVCVCQRRERLRSTPAKQIILWSETNRRGKKRQRNY